jgi:hypothetical protein
MAEITQTSPAFNETASPATIRQMEGTEREQDMASSPHTRGKSDDGLRTVPSSGWWRRVPVNMVKQDELMRNNKRRLSSFGNMTRSLEAGL